MSSSLIAESKQVWTEFKLREGRDEDQEAWFLTAEGSLFTRDTVNPSLTWYKIIVLQLQLWIFAHQGKQGLTSIGGIGAIANTV